MKKTYIIPELVVVALASRDAMLNSLSANSSLGTESGGTTTEGGVKDADIKGITDINIWDDKW